MLYAKAHIAAGLDEFVLFVAGAGGCGYSDPDSIREIGPAAEYFTNTYSYNPAKDIPWNIKLVEEFGVSVLLVEQYVSESLRISHRAYVMELGRIVLEGPSSEVIKSEHLRKAYLAI